MMHRRRSGEPPQGAEVWLALAGEVRESDGVQMMTVSMDSLNDFAEYISALTRAALADWIEAQPGTLTPAELADRIRYLRAEH